ncbi:testis-expressed protein 11-like isoform X5 [Dreissena polymorpha]|uniref:testis-expressed protein 11-like isoform X5 n=1 Tax=Dreissena polymorpha TaxID=45954 RepID=UPI002264D804|nr:testis-expressed protein 11-like isoform X5 [Dreissena polymorpha]
MYKRKLVFTLTLCSEVTKDPSTTTWSVSVDSCVKHCDQSLPLPEATKPEHNKVLSELEGLAVELWNYSVAIKTKGAVTNSSNAKIRYVAFLVLECCGQKDNSDHNGKRLIMLTDHMLRKQAPSQMNNERPTEKFIKEHKMGLKSGRAWLDAGQPDLAEKVFSKTEKCLKSIQKSVIERKLATGESGFSETLERQKLELEQDLFTLSCYRAETLVALCQPDDALQYMMTAKDLLPKFPKQAGFLCMLCYNTGVELYRQKLFCQTIIWLRESYELGKNMNTIGPRNQARTLRLLANVYLDHNPEENVQNALNAVSLANTEHSHPAGIYLKLKILMLENADNDVIKRCMGELLKVPELTVDLSLHTLQLVNKPDRLELVMWLIEELLRRFEHSPDLGRLMVTNTEVLLEAGMHKEVKEFLEFCINAHHKGKTLDFAVKKQFHIIFWEQAAIAFETEDFQSSLEWYNFSLALYGQSNPGDLTLAKLQRNRANCYIALKAWDKANTAITESLKCDPNCRQTQFILFSLALQENATDKACEALRKLCSLSAVPTSAGDATSDSSGLVALAAQQALDCERVDTACVALEHLVAGGTDPVQVLKALRCLVRLKLTNAEQEEPGKNDLAEISSYISKGYEKLAAVRDMKPVNEQLLQTEADWFMKIAWNLALQCEDKPEHMKELYTMCSKLLTLGVQDENSKGRQMTCLLMSAAACLQVARTSGDNELRRTFLEDCLQCVSSCRQLSIKLNDHSIGNGVFSIESKKKETDILLLLYEFEARVHLKDSGVEAVLEKALTVSGSDMKTFETLAAIALEPPTHNRSVAVRVLRVAIRKHLQATTPDINKCSKLFHSLIQLCLSGGGNQDLAGKEEAWNYYGEVLDLVNKADKGVYPEMEIVWLMTKAWNCGINFYSHSRYSDAEKWCGLSMRMLKYLDTFKDNYQDHMSNVYADILAKVSPAETPGAAIMA